MTDAERELVSVLLSADFPGKVAIAAQVDRAQVRVIDPEGSLELSITDGPRAEVVRRIPVEAETEDEDGITVHVLLHVENGFVNELEFYREDSEPPRKPIEPGGLRVIVF